MITVKVSDLKKMVEGLEKDKIEYVDIQEFEEHEFDGDIIPLSLNFMAYDGEGAGIDYDGIEHIEISSTYKWDNDTYDCDECEHHECCDCPVISKIEED
ncbi:hypothetical protein [Clostridium tagluense]|uniref:hypothetical protein n=1 Tax=Clostridium tagluense TaxID=360422 RepID=UPI001CF20327|nr:hypothetical protein [Clostridium tagluense]MCB2297073.1 hypothetical protein [Clostridium tagluense]